MIKNLLNYEVVAKNIRYELKKYIIDNKLKSLIIGISGGIDSALCVLLAHPVCKELNIPLIGRCLSIESNKSNELKRAHAIGYRFCFDYQHYEITDTYCVIKDMFERLDPPPDNESELDKKIRRGNIKARTRMIYLYNLSQQHKGMVLSTDNLTEYNLGFWSQHGDVGDYGMIQNLWKNEVYSMAQQLALSECDGDKREAIISCIYATPTDGLGITESDLDQIGAKSYQEVDLILQDYFEACMCAEICNHEDMFIVNEIIKKIKHPVIKRHINSEFKRKLPINISRDIITRNAKNV